jgi:hypothetical protein
MYSLNIAFESLAMRNASLSKKVPILKTLNYQYFFSVLICDCHLVLIPD